MCLATPSSFMTEDQKIHLEFIKRSVSARIANKYRLGQQEHGGNLWERPVLRDILDEITDLNTYIVTFEQQLLVLHSRVMLCKELYANGKLAEMRDVLDHIDSAIRDQLPK